MGELDDLSYTYVGNRLTQVVDSKPNTTAKYHLPGTTAYTHDVNGNMKSRLNSAQPGNNITAIRYNYLNLPDSVSASGGTLTYVYDATGKKLRGTQSGTVTDYIDGIAWEGTALNLLHMEEGRITKSGPTYTYEYFLKDHLGNNRSGFKAATPGTASFRSDYYPFGLQYQEGIVVSSPENKYLYNGKELQKGTGMLDYGARQYDPVIGRWNVADPLAEKHPFTTPYHYVLNNPLLYSDEFGMDTIKHTLLKEVVITAEKSNASLNALSSGVPFNWSNTDYEAAQKMAGEGTRQTIKFAAEQVAFSLLPWARLSKIGKGGLSLLSFGSKTILPEVALIGSQKLLKIMHPKHAWNKVVSGGEGEVKVLISKTLSEGTEMAYGNTMLGSGSKVLNYNGEIIQVVTNKVGGGKIVVSNAWVITDPGYKWQALKVLNK